MLHNTYPIMKTFFLSFYFEIQSTLRLTRELFVCHSFEIASNLYIKFKTGPSWQVHTKELLSYPEESLGFHLGCFLLQHQLEPQPRCEDHDIFHVLTDFQIDTAQEIAMQYWLWGNGKRSPFVLLAMLVGAVLYIDQHLVFTDAYLNGSASESIHQLDFKQYLSSPISLFKSTLVTINS
jgi:ubiquinone biosynthesis protein Coq4